MTRTLTPDQVQEAIERYSMGESGHSIGKSLGVTGSAIYSMLNRRGVTRRAPGPAPLPMNHERFDELDEESLYWLGFIAADGSIVPNKDGSDALSIGLSVKDLNHLEKFRDFLGSSHTINHYTGNGSYGAHEIVQLKTRSQIVTNRLRNLGVKGPTISEELTQSRDFWRGMIDGDGSIGNRPDKASVALCGYLYVLEPYTKFLKEHLGIKSNITPMHSIYRVRVGIGNAYKVIDYLYRDNNISLDRKQALADKTLEYFDNRRK